MPGAIPADGDNAQGDGSADGASALFTISSGSYDPFSWDGKGYPEECGYLGQSQAAFRRHEVGIWKGGRAKGT